MRPFVHPKLHRLGLVMKHGGRVYRTHRSMMGHQPVESSSVYGAPLPLTEADKAYQRQLGGIVPHAYASYNSNISSGAYQLNPLQQVSGLPAIHNPYSSAPAVPEVAVFEDIPVKKRGKATKYKREKVEDHPISGGGRKSKAKSRGIIKF